MKLNNDLPTFLKPPRYADYEIDIKARIIYVSLLVSIVAGILLVLANFNINSPALNIALALVSFFCILGVIFFRKIPLDVLAICICSYLWLVMTFNLFDGAALHDEGVAAFPILILFTGFLFDWEWAVVISTVMSVFSVVMVYLAGIYCFYPLNPKFPPSTWRLFTLIIFFTVFGVVSYVIKKTWMHILKNLRDSYESSLREIAERKRVEAEIQALNTSLEQHVIDRTRHLDMLNHQLESFSYSVSHDLRAPLRSIDGYYHALQMDYGSTLNDDGQKMLERIGMNIGKMNEMIEALLKFSRLGRQGVNKKWVKTRIIVEDVIVDLKAETGDQKVAFIVEDLPDCEADPALLKHIWFNLISNAVKYSRRCERAEIKISSLKMEGYDSPVYFVQDNGVGFDMQYAKKLFGVFQRLHSAAEFEGTGVGLAIVQSIVEHHGGKIWAKAEVNQGATFYFTLS